MANGFKWSIDWDTNPLRRGAQQASDAIDDAAEVFEDFAKEADRATEDVGDDLADGIKDGGRKAETALEKLEDKMRDAADSAKGRFKVTGDTIGDDVKRGTDKAGDGLDEFKDEANDTAREAAASFDGSADSIVDMFQEVAANAFVGFGPAGMAAGLGIAAGIGLGIAALQMSAEKAAETKQKIIDLAGTIREAGGDINDIDWGEAFREFGNEIANAKSWFEPWQEASKTNFETIKADAERFRLDYQMLFQGMAGDTEQAARGLEILEERIRNEQDALDEATEAAGRGEEVRGRTAVAIKKEVDGLTDLRDRLQESSGQTEEAIELQQLMEESYKNSAAGIEESNDALRENAELTAAAVVSELDFLDAVDATTVALQENKAAGFDKNTAAGRENLRTLADLADTTMRHSENVKESTGSQAAANSVIMDGRNKLIEQARALGMTEAQAAAYVNQLGLVPREVSTNAKVTGTDTVERELANATRSRVANITAMTDSAAAQIELNRLTQSRTVDVYVRTHPGTTRAV